MNWPIALKARVLEMLEPGLTATFDSACVVDTENRIVHLNLAMKHFLGLSPRALKSGVVLCDHLKLAACKKDCRLLEAIRGEEPLRLEGAPAEVKNIKHRISMSAVPLRDPGLPRISEPIGALIIVRDTTGEVLLQAKYHKVLKLLEDIEEEKENLKSKIRGLQDALSRFR
jgi:PAS domain-containing protein